MNQRNAMSEKEKKDLNACLAVVFSMMCMAGIGVGISYMVKSSQKIKALNGNTFLIQDYQSPHSCCFPNQGEVTSNSSTLYFISGNNSCPGYDFSSFNNEFPIPLSPMQIPLNTRGFSTWSASIFRGPSIEIQNYESQSETEVDSYIVTMTQGSLTCTFSLGGSSVHACGWIMILFILLVFF